MIFRAAPIFTTRIRPFEVALLFCYLEEAARKEKSQYLSNLLSYVTDSVLWSSMDSNMLRLQRNCTPEQATAVLADAWENGGEPYFERDLGKQGP